LLALRPALTLTERHIPCGHWGVFHVLRMCWYIVFITRPCPRMTACYFLEWRSCLRDAGFNLQTSPISIIMPSHRRLLQLCVWRLAYRWEKCVGRPW
jgi:hypothetical protein